LGLSGSTVTEVVRFLDTFSLDECGKELYLTVKTDQEAYALKENLIVGVFLSNNEMKEYHGLPQSSKGTSIMLAKHS
jgi:hypothetical protein